MGDREGDRDTHGRTALLSLQISVFSLSLQAVLWGSRLLWAPCQGHSVLCQPPKVGGLGHEGQSLWGRSSGSLLKWLRLHSCSVTPFWSRSFLGSIVGQASESRSELLSEASLGLCCQWPIWGISPHSQHPLTRRAHPSMSRPLCVCVGGGWGGVFMNLGLQVSPWGIRAEGASPPCSLWGRRLLRFWGSPLGRRRGCSEQLGPLGDLSWGGVSVTPSCAKEQSVETAKFL